MKKRILVTGGAGFIGSNFVDRALETGHNVTVIDDLSAGELAFLPRGFNDFSIRDFADDHTLSLVRGQKFECVVHFAARPRVAWSVEHPYESNDTNVSKTLRLLNACRGNVERFVNTSSSSVYGDASILPTAEDCPHDPQSPYALQKSNIESYCRMFSKLYGLDTVSIRPFNVFGPHCRGSSPYATALAAWFDAAKAGRALRSDGTGEQSRDLTYVDNTVDVFMRCVEHPHRFDGEAFNAGTGRSVTNNEILAYFRREFSDCAIVKAPARPGDVMRTCASVKKANDVLGYVPIVDFWDGVERTREWIFKKEDL